MFTSIFLTDKKRSISHTFRECISRCFFQIIIRTYVNVVPHVYSPRKAFDIQRFKSNKKRPACVWRGFVRQRCVFSTRKFE